MSELSLVVGQTATGHMVFDETTPPLDGLAVSDNLAVATIALDQTDFVTWKAVALAPGVANISYTGTSVAPDVGPAEVRPMIVTVTAIPVAEHGDFNPANAV